MKSIRPHFALVWVTAAFLFAVGAVFQAARAQAMSNVVDIDLSSYYTDNWGTSSEVAVGTPNGPEIAAAPQDGNQGTDITFGDWNGNYLEVGSDGSGGNSSPLVIDTAAAPIPVDPVVNALLNTFYGQNGETNAVITFENNLDQTVNYSLVGDQTIRDYNNNTYTNDLQGYNTNSALGNVTTQNWWNNYSDPSDNGHQRLDVATFVLPSSWTGTDLESMTISNPYDGDTMTDSVLLSALQVASVPEPNGFGLVLLGLLGLGLASKVGRLRATLPSKK